MIALTVRTNTSGKAVACHGVGLRPGMVCMRTTARKYRFAARMNCCRRFDGKNVSGVYFEVRIRLFVGPLALANPMATSHRRRRPLLA